MFRHLDVPGVKVITNHVGIALEAADRDVELLLVGGHYRAPSNSVVGSFAADALRRTFANKAFIGVEGISLRSGLTTPVAAEAEVARIMIERTRGEVTVVADHSKLGTVADFVIASLEQVNRLVIDSGIGADERDAFAEAGVDVVVAGSPVAVAPDDG